MLLREIVLIVLAVAAIALLGWLRGRRLRRLFDTVRNLDLADMVPGYHHGRIEEVGLSSRAATQRDGDVTVTVAALSAKESRVLFGTNLASSGIQPVWLEVTNGEDAPYWLLVAGLDSDYFSAREAAYVRHGRFSRAANRQMDEFFDEVQFRSPVLPGTTAAGFVFSHLDEGAKPVAVDLIAPRRGLAKSFSFFVTVPGLRTDRSRIDLDGIYAAGDVTHLETEGQLRAALERLPAWTTNKSGSAHGDPLNLVLIGSREDLFPSFLRRGWHPTEAVYLGSLWKTVKSFLLGAPYRHSPVSPLYALGRCQDLAGQKARESIHQRNHLRLWLAPLVYQGKPVWLGQISRDIGVRFTLQTWNLTTHKIDPDVDEARTGLIQDLLYSQSLVQFGFAHGATPAPPAQPHRNLTGDPYFTDGLRAVLLFERRPVALEDVRVFEWERPPDRAAGPRAQADPGHPANRRATPP